MRNIVNNAIKEKANTYAKFFLKDEFKLSSLVKSKLEIYTSKKVKGEHIIRVSNSFSVVNAVQIVCKISIFKNLQNVIFIFSSNRAVIIMRK